MARMKTEQFARLVLAIWGSKAGIEEENLDAAQLAKHLADRLGFRIDARIVARAAVVADVKLAAKCKPAEKIAALEARNKVLESQLAAFKSQVKLTNDATGTCLKPATGQADFVRFGTIARGCQ